MGYAEILALVSALAGSPDLAAALPGAAQNVTIKQCPRPLPLHDIEGKTIVCGTVAVPEDRSKPDGRKIALEFAVLKAETRFAEPDPVVYLEGGPGGSAVATLTMMDWLFKPWRTRRDVVIFDQRSAGLSGSSVNCSEALSANALNVMLPGGLGVGGIPDASLIKSCVDELKAANVPLHLYNTTENARDVPVIMQSLGYSTYNIYGISYGTKLGLEVMRTAPEGVRAVIIDGVAPPWVHLYDSAALKNDEAIQTLVEQCAADKLCDSHFPELGRIIKETLKKAAAGEIMFQGTKAAPEVVLGPILTRNGKYNERPVTKYIPAYIYELWRGKEMPTVEMMAGRGFTEAAVGEADVTAAAASLGAEQKLLIQQMLDNAAIAQRSDQGMVRSVNALRQSVDRVQQAGALAGMFDEELSIAMVEVLKADKTQLRKALADYTAMQNAIPSKDVLSSYVRSYVTGSAQERLLALIASMTPKEVDASFAIIRRDSYAVLNKFLTGWYLDVYACQEDRPYNSQQGYDATIAKMKFPEAGFLSDGLAKAFYAGCEPFGMVSREGWHEPVASSIPTLSFGGSFDIQTPPSWSRVAVEKLTDAQVFIIPEAGHGSVAYQPCVAEMGVAFFDNPARKFDNRCAESIRIDWHIPQWAAKPAAAP